ncbi:phage tail tape measure protein [Citrobacter freundii]|uniref:phage tail tape measure protein n=1 Tax=Citrobacter freundii TaxID=546 RepID=UPI0015E9B849|nr:phage tail tape measure protein [Citrobacter freundii]QMJ04895.1 phage tail tape measure protein [Citrobacter freundii]QMJ13960.1 phage tail tape measure protein [Citrobacter freundii]
MTDQIASITLRADVSDLKTASNELDKLGQAASSAVAGADALADATKRVKPSAKEGAEALRAQHQEIKGLLESIDPTVAALGRLEDKQDHLKAVFSKGWLDSEEYEHYQKLLDQTRLKLTDTGEAAARAQIELAATQAAEKQSAALKNLLGSIDPTIRAFNTLDEQYAQLVAHFEAGRINGAQFEHFNQQLEDTRRKLTGIADAMPQALSRQELAAQRAGISIGQYNAALRTLPAQFTDIATQLAGGQSPFLILLQQGGQIKDQFGSVKGAVSGVGSYLRTLAGALTPATLGIGALAVGAGALATAWYQGAQEATEFNKQLILTGRYSAESAGQLADMALKIGGASGKVSAAARTLAQVAGAGTFKPEQLESVTRAAMAMEQATGQSVDATVKNFQKLYASPTKASEELNSTMHYLTASQYEYISSLERRGDKEGAAEAAAKAYSQAEQQRAQATLENMGLIDRILRGAADAWGKYWDAAMGIGRTTSDSDRLEQVRQQIKTLSDTSRPGVFGLGSIGDGGANARQIAELKQQQSALEFVIKSQQGYAAAQARATSANEAAIAGQQELNKYLDAGTTTTEKRSQAVARLNKLIAENAKAAKETQFLPKDQRVTLWSDADIARARKGIDEMYKEAKTAKTPAIKVSAGDRGFDSSSAETLTLQAQLKTLQEHRDINDVISQQRKQQWELISKITILETAANDPKGRALTLDEKSLLASKERLLSQADINAGLGDQIAKQQKLNSLSDQAIKFGQQQAAKQAEIAAAAQGTSAREAERAATRQRLTEAYAFNPEAQRKVLADQEETYRKEDELRQDWQAGAKRAWADYADSATNTYENVRSVAGATFNGLSDMLSDLATTGTANFKQFARSILKMISDVTSRLLIVYGIQQAMGWVTGNAGGGNTPGGAYANAANSGTSLFANGAVLESPGLHQYVNGIYDSPQHFTFQGASKFAKGGVFGEAGPEAIMPLTRDSAGRLGVRAQGSGGNSPQINVDIYVDNKGNSTSQTSSSSNAAALDKALGERIKYEVSEGIRRALRNGGQIYNDKARA